MSIERFNRHMDDLLGRHQDTVKKVTEKSRMLQNELAKQDRLIEGIRHHIREWDDYHRKPRLTNFQTAFAIYELLRLYDNGE